jgi:hypothetical protein
MSSLLTQRFISQYGNLANRYNYVSPTGKMSKQLYLFLAIIGIVVGIILIASSRTRTKSTKNTDEYVDEVADEYDDELVPVQKTKSRSLLQKILLVIGILVLLSSFSGAGYYGFIYFTKYLPQYNEWYSRLPNTAIQDLSILKNVSTLESLNKKNRKNLRK